MPLRVVINADDFGLHPAVNEGIEIAARDGVLTSTSIMACGEAFEDASERVQKGLALDVGVHLTIVEERPLSSPETISSLVGNNGRFLPSYRSLALRWFAGRINMNQLQREFEAQIDRILKKGIQPSHLDSHQHVHALPGFWKLVLKLAEKYKIPYVRLPSFDQIHTPGTSPVVSLLRGGVNGLARWRMNKSKKKNPSLVPLRGAAWSGEVSAEILLSLLNNLDQEFSEILLHPGKDNEDLKNRYEHWGGYNWALELEALLDSRVRERCQKGDIVLTSFSREPSQ